MTHTLIFHITLPPRYYDRIEFKQIAGITNTKLKKYPKKGIVKILGDTSRSVIEANELLRVACFTGKQYHMTFSCEDYSINEYIVLINNIIASKVVSDVIIKCNKDIDLIELSGINHEINLIMYELKQYPNSDFKNDGDIDDFKLHLLNSLTQPTGLFTIYDKSNGDSDDNSDNNSDNNHRYEINSEDSSNEEELPHNELADNIYEG